GLLGRRALRPSRRDPPSRPDGDGNHGAGVIMFPEATRFPLRCTGHGGSRGAPFNQRKEIPMRLRNRKGVIGAALLVVALIAAGCGSGDDAKEGPTITIGAQNFGESAILAEVYGQALTDAGYETAIQPLGGFRELVLGSFESDEINFTPEYAASMLEYLNADVSEATGDADETTSILQGYLDEIGFVAFAPSPAIDTNAFVVTPETADGMGIRSISDMAGKEADL